MGSTQTKAPPRSASNAVGASTSTATTAAKTRPPDKRLRVVFTGAGGSGKTTVLYALKLGTTGIKTNPTMGFNVEDIDLNRSTTMDIWDVGGGDKISPLLPPLRGKGNRGFENCGCTLFTKNTCWVGMVSMYW